MIFNDFVYNRLNMNNNLLIDFFKDLIVQLEQKSINEAKLRQLSEFMLRYRFEHNGPSTENDDFIKFMTMGWYVYSNINQNENNNII